MRNYTNLSLKLKNRRSNVNDYTGNRQSEMYEHTDHDSNRNGSKDSNTMRNVNDTGNKQSANSEQTDLHSNCNGSKGSNTRRDGNEDVHTNNGTSYLESVVVTIQGI